MNNNYYIDNDKILVENERGDLSVCKNEDNVDDKLALENLIENTNNKIKKINKNKDEYIKYEKKKFRLVYYAFTILVSAILTLYTVIPLLMVKSSVLLSGLAPTGRVLAILFSLIGPVLACTSIMTIIGENVILPKKVNKINEEINFNLLRLNELLEKYKLDLDNYRDNNIAKDTINEDKPCEYKYVFNKNLLKTPYEYVDVSKEENHTFIKKKIL